MRVEILASTTSDNFFYLLEHDGHTALVDPIDAGQAVEALRRLDLELDLILNTHWHPDHVGGNQDVREAFPGARLVGPADEAELIEEHGGVALDEGVRGGDRVELGGAALEVLSTPGHTAGHVSFRVEGHLLSGDTIFSAGAGNCRFGGDPGTLYQTFRGALRELDGQLTIYPGHDYAERNLEFGLSILEGDEALTRQLARQREVPERTLEPTELGRERDFNPFLRFDEPALRQALQQKHPETWEAQRDEAGGDEDEATWRALRALRDQW